jgi:hypothetical protein
MQRGAVFRRVWRGLRRCAWAQNQLKGTGAGVERAGKGPGERGETCRRAPRYGDSFSTFAPGSCYGLGGGCGGTGSTTSQLVRSVFQSIMGSHEGAFPAEPASGSGARTLNRLCF